MLRERLIPLPDIFPTEPWAAGAKGLDPQHLSVSAQVVDDLTWGMMKARS
jgi:hypothetical protein